MSGPAVSAVAGAAGMDILPVIEEAADDGGAMSGGKRRKTGAQKRLYEDTRFGEGAPRPRLCSLQGGRKRLLSSQCCLTHHTATASRLSAGLVNLAAPLPHVAGIYDDRRYRNAAPATSQPRRQSSQTSAGAGGGGQATAASAPPRGAATWTPTLMARTTLWTRRTPSWRRLS